MINAFFNDVTGSYIPSFFMLEIEQEFKEDIAWNELPIAAQATFIHEYIHYLQGLTTFTDYNEFYVNMKIIQANLHHLGTKVETEIVCPVRFSLEGSKYALLNDEVEFLSGYRGDTELKRIHHINSVKCELSQNGLYPHNINEINIYHDDKPTPYVLGFYAIAESMAYLCENRFFPASIRKNEFPYNACELVCESVYPELLDCVAKNYTISFLCEVALSNKNSGWLFYTLLHDMKKANFIPSSEGDLLSFVNKKHFNYAKAIKDLDDIYNDGIVEVIDMFCPPDLEPTMFVNKRLKKLFTEGRKFARSSVAPITTLFFDKDIMKAVAKLSAIMKVFDVPSIIDVNNTLFGGVENLTITLGQFALLKIFSESSGTDCALYEFCKSSQKEHTICKTEPWNQVNERGLCPFAFYWYRSNLSGKSIKKRI